MGKLKISKKFGKLKLYALQLNTQPQRLLAITSNDRKGVITSLTSKTSELAKVQLITKQIEFI